MMIKGWTSVTEHIPPLNKEVLVCRGMDILIGRMNLINGKISWWKPDSVYSYGGDKIDEQEKVTHWMPLPHPPIKLMAIELPNERKNE